MLIQLRDIDDEGKPILVNLDRVRYIKRDHNDTATIVSFDAEPDEDEVLPYVRVYETLDEIMKAEWFYRTETFPSE